MCTYYLHHIWLVRHIGMRNETECFELIAGFFE